MAKKLSIDIDLRNSRHVDQKIHTLNDNVHTTHQAVQVEFKYRYDRIFTVFIGFLLLIIALYFIVSTLLFEQEQEMVIVTTTTEKPAINRPSDTEEIIKEKHLQIPEQSTSRERQRPVFLFYETTDVLKTFQLLPGRQKNVREKIPTKTIQSFENLTSSSHENLSKTVFVTLLPDELLFISPTMTINHYYSSELIMRDSSDPVVTVLSQSQIEPQTGNIPETLLPEEISLSTSSMTVRHYYTSGQKIKDDPGLSTSPNDDLPVSDEFIKHSINQTSDFIKIFSENLSRVLLSTNIHNKEPVNELSSIVKGPADRAEKLYLFTQLDNSIGKIIEHQWWYQGKLLSSNKFTALGNRWRCYSSKNIATYQQGNWLLKVVDQKGKILSSINFDYQVN